MPPHLSDIRFYPVKGLRGIPVPHRSVEPWGLAGDRRWMIIDGDGTFVSQRTLPPLAVIGATPAPDGGILLTAAGHEPLAVPRPEAGAGSEALTTVVWRSAVPALAAGDAADAWLGAVLGVRCRLVYMADPTARPVSLDFGGPDDRVSLADGFPVLLTTTASLADLNRRLGAEAVPMERFRPNLVIDGVDRPFAEDLWRRVRVGGVVFRVVKPCARCAVTTVDQNTGKRLGTEPLRTLATFRRIPSGGVLFGTNLIPDNTGEVRVGDGFDVLETAAAPDAQFATVDAG